MFNENHTLQKYNRLYTYLCRFPSNELTKIFTFKGSSRIINKEIINYIQNLFMMILILAPSLSTIKQNISNEIKVIFPLSSHNLSNLLERYQTTYNTMNVRFDYECFPKKLLQ